MIEDLGDSRIGANIVTNPLLRFIKEKSQNLSKVVCELEMVGRR
jgi:hypothetical protein